MSKIEVGRWSDQLRRMTGQKGTSSVAEELSPEVSAVFLLEGESVEWNYLKGVRNLFGSARLSAAPGFTSKWRLRNPVASGAVGIIDRIEMSGPATGTFLGIGGTNPPVTTDFTTPVLPRVIDSRWDTAAGGGAVCVWSEQNSDATAPFQNMARWDFAVEPVGAGPFILLPGSAIEWGSASGNQPVATWIKWRERGIPQLEL